MSPEDAARAVSELRSRLDTAELQIRGLAQDNSRLLAALSAKGGERGTPHRQLAELGERDKWIVSRLDALAAEDVATRAESDGHRVRQDERIRGLEQRVWAICGAAAAAGGGIGAAISSMFGAGV